MSIALAWCDFKTYGEEVGPGRGQPPRPAQCPFCDGERVWFNGWRRVLITLRVDGRPMRPAEGVAVKLVRCARRACRRSWALRPAWLYPHRSLEPDLAEAAALAYLLDPETTYTSVATAVGCSWVTVWRWVGWLATLVMPAVLLARAAWAGAGAGADPGQLPRTSPAAARARSPQRARAVLHAVERIPSSRSPREGRGRLELPCGLASRELDETGHIHLDAGGIEGDRLAGERQDRGRRLGQEAPEDGEDLPETLAGAAVTGVRPQERRELVARLGLAQMHSQVGQDSLRSRPRHRERHLGGQVRPETSEEGKAETHV